MRRLFFCVYMYMLHFLKTSIYIIVNVIYCVCRRSTFALKKEKRHIIYRIIYFSRLNHIFFLITSNLLMDNIFDTHLFIHCLNHDFHDYWITMILFNPINP